MTEEEVAVKREDPTAKYERQKKEKEDYIEARRVRLSPVEESGSKDKPKPKAKAKTESGVSKLAED